MFVPSDHPLFTLEDQVKEICQTFLETHGLNYFQYSRGDKNGSIATVLTNTKFFKKFFVELDFPFMSSFRMEHFLQSSYWFLWDEEPPSLPIQLARKDYQLYHGITFLRRSLSSYEKFSFAMAEERSNAASYYLSRLPTFERFINFFEKEYSEFLKVVISHSIQVSEPQREINYKSLCLKSVKKISIIGALGATYITPQELVCLQLWLKGMKGKDIACRVGIAPKTVETYLARIKIRSGFDNRLNLLEMVTHNQRKLLIK